MAAVGENPLNSVALKELEINGQKFSYYDIAALGKEKLDGLPYSIRILLESAARNCDNFQVNEADVTRIVDWEKESSAQSEIPFRPARVLLQDFTGVPTLVDFAAMRDAVKRLGGNPDKINPVCPTDLVIDHSVQVDISRSTPPVTSHSPVCYSPNPGGGGLDSHSGGRIRTKRFEPVQDTTDRLGGPPRGSTRLHRHEPLASAVPPGQTYRVHKQAPQGENSISSTTPSSSRATSSPLVQPQPGNHPRHTAVPPDLAARSHSTVFQKSFSQTSAPVQSKSTLTQPTSLSIDSPFQGRVSQSELKTSLAPFKTCLSPAKTPLFPAKIPLSPAKTPLSLGKTPLTLTKTSLSPSKTTQSQPKVSEPSVCHICAHTQFPVQHTLCPFHSQETKGADALEKNQELEFERNKERFLFCKWGAQALRNMLIVPPGSGIVHQVNLEYLARAVFSDSPVLYPDSVVGTDSHTTMINGLGVLGWGVGGIEAEAVMLGQAISMVLPEVVGYRLCGDLHPLVTSTDVVLTVTKHLRQIGVVGKFVEFFGPGVASLSIADRATISNMCPEYGATTGFFAMDDKSIEYLRQTGRDEGKIAIIEQYLKANNLFRDFTNSAQDPKFSQVVELDLSTVVPCCSGPKRPHDRVSVSDMKEDFQLCLNNKVGFKGYAIPQEKQTTAVPFIFDNQEYVLKHGSVVIAAITSCTNTSNPSVMLGAGLLAKNAVEAGLTVQPYIKTSLSPGSGVVTYYLRESGVTPYLEKLGFNIVGYGCMTCIGNSGPLPDEVGEAIEKGDLVACGVLSGNRNFEGRIHPLTRANYLASPPLVIAYALAGTVDIDFEKDPIGTSAEGKAVFLRDIWPTREQIQTVEKEFVVPAMFKDVYSRISDGNQRWNGLAAPATDLYPWDNNSTYIKSPPFLNKMEREIGQPLSLVNAPVLLNLGDSVTTDHISPAGSIARNSSAARYLASRGLVPREFNSYGSRRGHDEVMARGTFANIRLVNKFVSKPGPRTVYHPTGEEMDIFDVAERYQNEGQPSIILAGKEYGSGSSRDWAAKGPWMLGVRAVIAESYERIHRSNLVGMGLVPLQYLPGQNAESLGLTGKERYSIQLPADLQPGQILTVQLDDGRSFQVRARFDTEVELVYFRNGGILNYMVRRML